jgi:hypothetical protein
MPFLCYTGAIEIVGCPSKFMDILETSLQMNIDCTGMEGNYDAQWILYTNTNMSTGIEFTCRPNNFQCDSTGGSLPTGVSAQRSSSEITLKVTSSLRDVLGNKIVQCTGPVGGLSAPANCNTNVISKYSLQSYFLRKSCVLS